MNPAGSIISFDRELFLYLNGLHCEVMDTVMVLASDKFVWIPLYMLMLFLLFYRKDRKAAFCALAGMILVFALCDSLSFAAKNIFMRLRPGHDPALEGLVRLLEGRGGKYGFFSSHASNVFGLAMFSSLYLRNRTYTVFIMLWAALVSYSRIYVGRHFPADIIVGALFGLAVGYAVYRLYGYLLERIENNPKQLI